MSPLMSQLLMSRPRSRLRSLPQRARQRAADEPAADGLAAEPAAGIAEPPMSRPLMSRARGAPPSPKRSPRLPEPAVEPPADTADR